MKIIQLLKDWTLPVAMAAGVAIFIIFHNLSFLDPISAWYEPHNNDILPICMFFVLFTTFCKADFRKLLPVRWHLFIGLVQIAFILFFVWLIRFTIAEGETLVLLEAALLCMICPCASAAAVVTDKLGGSLEEITSYTFISNIFSALCISALFPLLPRTASYEHLSFLPLFITILKKVSLCLLFPMLAAYIVKHHWPWLLNKILKIKDLSFYIWSINLMIVSATTAKNINDSLSWIKPHFLLVICVLSLIICALQFIIGRGLGSTMRKTVECGQALGQKNTEIAIWSATVFLNPLSTVGPGCYILWQNLVNSIEIYDEQRKRKRGAKTARQQDKV